MQQTYEILDKLYETDSTLVCRGKKPETSQSVMLKIKKLSTLHSADQIQQEAKVLSSLSGDGIPKLIASIKHNLGDALVFEDIGGEPLSSLLESQTLSLRHFLSIAIKACLALESIHHAGITHTDVCPHNIIVNIKTNQAQLINYDHAINIPSLESTFGNISQIQGSLAFVSPEQTGRMNRAIDYRTDLYSLGVCFYQMLTGELPFKSKDALTLVHEHLATAPTAPIDVDPDIPLFLSDMTMKLLSKNSDARYQSAYGIRRDLERAELSLEQTGAISVDSLASDDIAPALQIPQKLYGRSAEIDQLMTVFESVSRGTSHVLLVAGYSGVGKTSLIHEIHRPITKQRGFFVEGKYDQYQRNTPYSAWIQALGNFISYLLTSSEKELNLWRGKFLAGLGSNAKVISDVIPNMERIIGEQPEVTELHGAEAQNRFNYLFRSFIDAIAQEDHPLVIFLDDLQWMDTASVDLFKLLAKDPGLHHFLVIGAYRDNEVDATHQLSVALKDLAESGVAVDLVTLDNLTVDQVNELVADAMLIQPKESLPLSEVIYSKTAGNPFFTHQLLYALEETGAVSLNSEAGHWAWDFEKVEAMGLSDNVVELMVGKVKQLPEKTFHLLKFAACIGARFEPDSLAIISEITNEQLHDGLRYALQRKLIRSHSSHFHFAHDRVQQAVYSLIAETEKVKAHRTIGKLLLESSTAEQLFDNIFDIVNHLNTSQALIESDEETMQLAELNLVAAERTIASTAYESAQGYLDMGIKLAGETIWKKNKPFAFKLHLKKANVQFLLSNFSESEEVINHILQQDIEVLNKVDAYSLLITQYSMRGLYNEALKYGRAALSLLGMEWPAGSLESATRECLKEFEHELSRRPMNSLLERPQISDPIIDKRVWLLDVLQPCSYLIEDRSVMPYIVISAATLILKHGRTKSAAAASVLSWIATLQSSSMFKDYKKSYAIGTLAVKMAEFYNDPFYYCKASLMYRAYSCIWGDSVRSSLSLFPKGFQAGLQSGNFEYASFHTYHYIYDQFSQGCAIAKILEDARRYMEFSIRVKNQWVIDLIKGAALVLEAMVQESPDALSDQTRSAFIEEASGANSTAAICRFLTINGWRLYLCKEHMSALSEIEQAEGLLHSIPGAIGVIEHNHYHSLILAKLFESANNEQRRHYESLLEENQMELKECSDCAPMNYLQKYYLIEAERCRLANNTSEAMAYYEKSIGAARKNGFLQDEALGNELAGHFYLQLGVASVADTHLEKAALLYKQWGAEFKWRQMIEDFPQLQTNIDSSQLTAGATADIDLTSIIKATRSLTLAGELSEVITEIMNIVMENSGAERIVLLMRHQEAWAIDAENHIGAQGTVSLPNRQYELGEVNNDKDNLLPDKMIAWCARSGEPLIASGDSDDERFTKDHYTQSVKPKSMLCLPLIYQGNLNGLLYLENRLTKDVFTEGKVKLFEVLGAVAAVFLQNAVLYSEIMELNRGLEVKVEQRTAELKESQVHAEQANLAKSEFLANMSHELRTPLNAVLGFSELMTRDPQTSSAQNEKLHIIMRSGQHLLGLINDVLDMSKIEAGYTGLNLEPCDLHHLLHHIAEMFNMRTETTDLLFNLELGPSLPHYVLLDFRKFRQVLINLLGNAVKFTESGSVTLRADADKLSDDTWQLRLEIEDTGIGISAESIETIFDPFVQVQAPIGPSVGKRGTGLGLAISRQFIQLMGGKVTVDSIPGKGSVFRVAIPVQEIEARRVAAPISHQVTGLAAAQPAWRILIVEDEAINRLLLRTLLQPVGFDIREAVNGEEAVRQFEAWHPHLIWMDRSMPVLDGLAATQRIRTLPGGDQVKIIALTASVFKEQKNEVLEAGSDGFVCKPYRPDEIFTCMAKHLGVRYLYHEKTVGAEGC